MRIHSRDTGWLSAILEYEDVQTPLQTRMSVDTDRVQGFMSSTEKVFVRLKFWKVCKEDVEGSVSEQDAMNKEMPGL